jgi:hypothetical protein
LEFCFEFEKDRSPMKIGQFLNFKMGRSSCENKLISGKHGCLLKFFLEFKKDRSPMKIGKLLNFKMGRLPMKIDQFQGSKDTC